MTANLDSVSTIPAMLDFAASRYGDRPFIVDGDITLRFSDTAKLAEQVAAGLVSSGFNYGDRAAIWAPNCADWIVTALGILSAGGVLVTVNTRYKGAEAANIVNDSGAKVAFVIDRFLDTDYAAELSRHSIPTLAQVVSISLDSLKRVGNGLAALANNGATWLENAGNRERLEQQRARICGESRSDILFTSGTTGRPKGVVTRHRQNLKAFATFSDILGLDEDDRYLIINPFFHSFGYKAGWLASLMRGATVYPLAVFDVPEVLARIEAHQITVMPGPPTLFQSILSHPELEACDISSLKKATTGAAVIPTQLIVDMRETLAINTVITAYGLSETCGLVTMCRQGDAADTIAQTSGRAIPGVEVAIIGADGNPLPAGESGEIVVRGFNVMESYFNNAEATQDTIDEAGWLHTGDIGSLDADGNLRITDRLKDMFICGGFNCYPAEIENQMLAHEHIAQVAVVGMPDERMGEVGAAFVVPATDAAIDAATLTEWCRSEMANYKVPRRIEFVTALPCNASGKVLKTELRELLQ